MGGRRPAARQLQTDVRRILHADAGIGDSTIKDVAENYAKAGYFVEILTGDAGLKAYQPAQPVAGKTADWDVLVKDCLYFANWAGGRLLIGNEDGEFLRPIRQAVPSELLDRLHKRTGGLPGNLQPLPSLPFAANGGEFIELAGDKSVATQAVIDGVGRALGRGS